MDDTDKTGAATVKGQEIPYSATSTYESDLLRAEIRDLRIEVGDMRESIRYLNTTIFSLCVVGYAFYLYHTRRVH